MNKYELGRTVGDKTLCIVVDGDTAICTSGDPRLGTSEHAEHMAYLVKAGNAHDELVAALRGFVGAYECSLRSESEGRAKNIPAGRGDAAVFYGASYRPARAALAKAGAL